MKQCGTCEWIVTRLSKDVRLLPSNFMLQNPSLNKIGGVDSEGQLITVQIDESLAGKRKYGKGKLKPDAIWVLGAVEVDGDSPYFKT